jgi:hypothetical protein
MLLFAVTVFLSAFLLFLVEPLIGKAILPWFGGAPAVWSSCLLFFQVALLGGYFYSHALVSRLSTPRQVRVHSALLVAALLALAAQVFLWGGPLLPGLRLKPPDSLYPMARVLGVLALSIGLPFFALAATGPLLQAWFAKAYPGGSTYRLYALSNAGSFLGLLGYPFAIEPTLPLRSQAWAFAGGFALFAVGIAASGTVARRSAAPAPSGGAVASASAANRPSRATFSFWTALAACPSIMLLAVTTQLSQEVAVSPFLWVLPLAVYLLTFILCFESDRWYTRARFLPAMAVLLLGGFVLALRQRHLAIGLQIAGFLAILFATSMFCHGELARRRPAPEHLTRFYLAVSLGGTVGGLLVPLLAPVIFNDYFELDASMVIAWLLAIAVLASDPRSAFYGPGARLARLAVAGELLLLIFLVAVRTNFWEEGRLWIGRNFYGQMRVLRECDPAEPNQPPPDCAVGEIHGRTLHGVQFLNPAEPSMQRTPATYFTANAGIGRALESARVRAGDRPLRVAVIGLGAGTLAAYGMAGDVFRFYEINPAVVELAQPGSPYFSYLTDTPAAVEMVLGDARLSLERELREGHPGRFDVLALDAFSSDSIPAHLLTREALEIYKRHLAGPESILAIHVSNIFLDLVPLVWSLSDAAGLACQHIESGTARNSPREYSADWMLLSPTRTSLETPEIVRDGKDVRARRGAARAWTDDHTNILATIRWEEKKR